jgi:hypothetical protein
MVKFYCLYLKKKVSLLSKNNLVGEAITESWAHSISLAAAFALLPIKHPGGSEHPLVNNCN